MSKLKINETSNHCIRKTSLGIIVMLFMLLLVGCHRRIYDNSSSRPTEMETKPRQIVFISAELERDTLKATYSMTQGNAELLPGRLKKTEILATDNSSHPYTYEKLDAAGKVLSVHALDDPFVMVVETVGENGMMQRVVSERNHAQLFLRVAYVDGLASIVFKRNGIVMGKVLVE